MSLMNIKSANWLDVWWSI